MKQYLEDIIKNWLNQALPSIKPRQLDLARLFDPKIQKIISVVGFRRVGKTYALLDFAAKYGKGKCLYINFEDERLPHITQTLTDLSAAVSELFGATPLVLLLDEIQNIPLWSRWARRINEAGRYRLIISGSSSKLSSRELPTELRGQALTVEAAPLNWSEFLSFNNIDALTISRDLRLNALRAYLFFGGLPEIVLAAAELKPLIISEYFNTYVRRDIIERYRLRQAESLRELLRTLLNSTYFTISKIAHTLQSAGFSASKSTVMRYLNWIESSFFIHTVELFSPSVKNRRQAAKKMYSIDTYFSRYFGPRFSDNIGHLMEQAVFLELKRRAQTNDGEVFYWKDYSGNEVDFVVRAAGGMRLIQSCYASARSEIPPREIKALLKAAQQLHTSDLILVTWDWAGEIKADSQTVVCVPLWQWLLL